MDIVILGPTAVGKTDLSLTVAEELNAPIISVDSRQCYKYLDIGTAKPSVEELERVKHFNISNFYPDENDNIAQFQNRIKIWDEELSRCDHKLYVGGSTLYQQSVITPIDNLPESDADNIRQLQKRIETEGLEAVYKHLKRVDPEYTLRMDGMNRNRIIRAMDVWMQTGRPFSSFHSHSEIEIPESMLVFGLKRERKHLIERINKRVESMLEAGLIQEVKSILDLGYSSDLQSLKTVGYREVISFFEGNISSIEEMTEKIKTNTRRYAKRQMTWFKRWNFIDWIDLDVENSNKAAEIILEKVAAKSNKG